MSATEITAIDGFEALEELPVGSIIRTGTVRVACKAWMADDFGEPDEWFETGDSTPLTSSDFDDFPHLLLYRGTDIDPEPTDPDPDDGAADRAYEIGLDHALEATA